MWFRGCFQGRFLVWFGSRADLDCFKVHMLAHSSTKSTLIYYLQLLINFFAPCSETLLSPKILVLLVTHHVESAIAGSQLYLWLLATSASTSHCGLEVAHRGRSPLENSHANLQSQT